MKKKISSRINIGAKIRMKRKEKKKKIRTIFNLGNVSRDEVRIRISPSSCHRFLSRHYLYPPEIGKDETNFHHNDGIFNDVKSKNFSFSIFITLTIVKK